MSFPNNMAGFLSSLVLLRIQCTDEVRKLRRYKGWHHGAIIQSPSHPVNDFSHLTLIRTGSEGNNPGLSHCQSSPQRPMPQPQRNDLIKGGSYLVRRSMSHPAYPARFVF
ncbi:hypothetical protein SODALDRAFT_378474 [Sodiomyces alkalinus F11]|uniref:Uncharacterized protein n=1 Tax=Sodiomyces alkalinus (strain CBS 110278 / VKM F-3762 / F11) TaxID=1314773 RepID=A0A3N2PY32_SODAK|nr:hypothetical protein SODALDRAFT_378474 [Sodiomyces alkalinus F11]ROT39378.1 hypothetical protein SODALDRAFT_378474 [Sodiomyces alkalinus F11]